MSNKSTPCAFSISYDGKTPCHGLYANECSELLHLDIKRIGGTAKKIPLYADPALCWTTEKPTQPGWYVWRINSCQIYPYLTRIYQGNHCLFADMKDGSWEHDIPLSEVKDREWYGPIPL